MISQTTWRAFRTPPEEASFDSTQLAIADEICDNTFTFYNEKHDLGGSVDWTMNPGTAHWGHDLNRFSFLTTLSDAFLHTGDERYAHKALALILSWIEQSETVRPEHSAEKPYMWGSYLNIAIHLMEWVACLAVIEQRAPGLLGEAETATISASIQEQVEWLDEVIPNKTTNWVQLGCRGVLATLAGMPSLPNAEELAVRAWHRVCDFTRGQLLPDGVQDEMTVHYHLCVAVCILDVLEYSPLTPVPAPDELWDLAGNLLHYLRQMITPDGEYIVALNNSDPRYGKSTQAFLERPINRQLLEKYRKPLRSECFPWAGVMIMREGESAGRNELYMVFDGGAYGTAHQHEDKLGFWLAAYGRSLLVDPGRHLYDWSDKSYWPYLKGTTAHSTITIDGLNQNSHAFKDVPGVWRPTEPQPLIFEKYPDGRIVAGAFYDLGYGPDLLPAVHYRLIFFYPRERLWVVVDMVDGEGSHTIESRFQFAPGGLRQEGLSVRTLFSDANLWVSGRAEDWTELRIACGEENPREGWFSPGINQIEAAPCAVFKAVDIALPWQSVTALAPYKQHELDELVIMEMTSRAEVESTPFFERLRLLQRKPQSIAITHELLPHDSHAVANMKNTQNLDETRNSV